MDGVEDSPHISCQQARYFSALRLVFFLSSTALLALFFVGCSGPGTAAGGGSGLNECAYASTCDTTCNDANCIDSGGSGSGTTDGGTSGGCSDSADPSCSGYDPTGTDGGGGGDGGCDPSTCGDSGDPGTGGDPGVGDPGDGGDTGIGDLRGYTGTVVGSGGGGDDGQHPVARFSVSQHLAAAVGALRLIDSDIALFELMANRLSELLIAQTSQTA